MTYEREAREVVLLVMSPPFDQDRAALAVADWLREFIAAREYGCTGIAEIAPSAPESDPPDPAETYGYELPSIEDWARIRREARGAVPRPPGSPRAEEVIRRLRDEDADSLELGPE